MAKFATLAGLNYFYQRMKNIFTEKFATKDVATVSADGLMGATDKAKLNGIAENANNYSLPEATSETLGGVRTGENISNDSGLINVEVMTAATDDFAGKAGLAPAPGQGDQEKFLRGDGTWQELPILTNEEIETIFDEADQGQGSDPDPGSTQGQGTESEPGTNQDPVQDPEQEPEG
ncbi:MAG: hypothetical protein J6E49_04230 [Acidaminococcaceae bacterium]|uniref:head fiber protein n=1 Tax=uncultured Succiniclasticum sp. TaxID=1500547 RepID=UPI001B6F37A7|nr:head fiber protein [uncultured Succiniclasticum sp.]MBP3812302.1 hypothetical protein [Acidaminococcaceae bacterium]MBQ5345851.1 hypothetical protein [Acidaminococcaceae bacterium]